MTLPALRSAARGARSRSAAARLRHLLLEVLNRRRHRRALLVYAVVVGLHLLEHVVQIVQVHAFGIPPREALALLGGLFPRLVANELLHTAFNSLQLSGLILLAPGFRDHRAARRLWRAALAFQGWHWLEHAFLQVQVLSGVYLYGALKQMSVLERFVPRVELHFGYNLLVAVPTVVALALYLRRPPPSSQARHAGSSSSSARRS